MRENLVNNFITRAISSFFLLVVFALLYIFKLNHFFFLVIFFLVYFELFKNKIINLFWIIVILIVYFIFLNFFNSFNDFISTYIIYVSSIYIIVLVLSFINSNILYCKILLNIFVFNSFIFFTLLYINYFDIFFIVIFLTSINDILAYIFGNFFKGPTIIPLISPNKTWSGTLSSYTFSVFFIILFFDFNFIYSFLLPITFFIGDIFFSNFKRIFNFKDYGSFIRGHGGFLDRFDSSFLSLSFTFLFFIFL